MAKQGISFLDNESGYIYRFETANDVLTESYSVILPEKNGTMALVEDIKVDIAIVDNTITFTKNSGEEVIFDMTKYLDDTTNTITSGVLDGSVIRFTREDGSIFNVDVSGIAGGDSIQTFVSTELTATAGQTVFDITYSPNFVNVFLNGSKLLKEDYDASNGSTVVLATPASAGDVLVVEAYTLFSLLSVYNKTDIDTMMLTKQDTLVSGNNIKTINGEDITGSGNIDTTNLAMLQATALCF